MKLFEIWNSKKGAEVIEKLMMIAIMGSMGLVITGFISDIIQDKNKDVIDNVDTIGFYNETIQ